MTAPLRTLMLVLCLLPALARAQASAQATAADAALRAIYQSEWAWRTQQAAGWDEDSDGGADAARQPHLPDVGPAAQAARLAYLQDVLRRLDAIDVAALSPGERLNYAVYRPQIEHQVAALRFREYEMPFNSDSAFWSDLDFMARAELRDAAAYRAYAARLRDVPRYFDQQIANMRAGLARGFSVPRAVLAYTDEALIDEHGRVIGVRRLAYSAFHHAHSASHVHGLIVMRRSAVDPVLTRIADLDAGADWPLTRLVARQGSVLHLPLVGRHWRQHPNQHHRRTRSTALGSLPSLAIP